MASTQLIERDMCLNIGLTSSVSMCHDSLEALQISCMRKPTTGFTYSLFPPDRVPISQYCNIVQHSHFATVSEAHIVYTQVLIWCISHYLATKFPRCETSQKISHSKLLMIYILESFRRALSEGVIKASTERRDDMQLKPIINNPYNNKRIRAIKKLRIYHLALNDELKTGLKMLKTAENRLSASKWLISKENAMLLVSNHQTVEYKSILETLERFEVKLRAFITWLVTQDSHTAEVRLICMSYYHNRAQKYYLER